MLVGSAAFARADGLPGGNCCVDLEERVAELEATTARKGNRRVSLTISGQVTTALMAWDDGKDGDIYVVDNTNGGGSSFSLAGNAKVTPSLTAGFQLVVAITSGARSHQVSQADDDGGTDGDSVPALTLANWYLDHKHLGRLTVGRINTATAGVSGINLGGTSVIANVNVGYWNRSFNARGAPGSWGDLLGGNQVNGSTLSRANAVSYTSPRFGGFQVSAAAGEDDLWDVALRYAGEHAGFRYAAGIGYGANVGGLGEAFDDDFGVDAEDGPSLLKGSASVMHVASGIYGTVAYVNQDFDDGSNDESTLWYFQGGISKNWTGLGNTAFYGEYANVDSFDLLESEVWGLGVVQHIDAAAMELFLSYRNYSGESYGYDADDMDIVMSGARIRF